MCKNQKEEKGKNIPFIEMKDSDFFSVFKMKERGFRGESEDFLIAGSTLEGIEIKTSSSEKIKPSM